MKAKQRSLSLVVLSLLAAILAAAVGVHSEEGAGSPGQPPAPTPGPDEPKLITARLYDWAAAWERNVLSIDEYRKFYDSDFSSKGLDLTAWMADKAEKARKAGCIQVWITNIKVEIHGDEAAATFVQHYVSSTYCDEGRKTLSLKRVGDSWLIVGEDQPTSTKCADRCQPRCPGHPDSIPANESLGWVRREDLAAKVIALYGAPESKTPVEHQEADDSWCRTYGYPGRGLEFYLCSDKPNGVFNVTGVRIFGKSAATTSRGIGIGTPRSDVVKAYSRLTEMPRENSLGLEDVECWCGLYFDFVDNAVSAISIWDLPE